MAINFTCQLHHDNIKILVSDLLIILLHGMFRCDVADASQITKVTLSRELNWTINVSFRS